MQFTSNYNLKKPEPLVDFYDKENDNGNMDIIDTTLKDHDERLNEIETTDTSSLTTSASITSLPTGSLYGKVTDVEFKGLSLVNSVVNGDFSNGTTGWLQNYSTSAVVGKILSITGNGANREPHITQYSIFKNTTDTFFIYVKTRVTNSSCQGINFGSYEGGGSYKNIPNPVINQWYEVYAKKVGYTAQTLYITHQYPYAATANGKVMEVDGDAGVFAINMTVFGIESFTEAQMLDLVRGGYFKGLQGVKNPILTTVGKNLFDKTKVSNVINQYYETEILLKRNTNYTVKWTGVSGENYRIDGLDSNSILVNYVNSQTTFNSGGNSKIRTYLNINNNVSNITLEKLSQFQLEEGTTATQYEPYKSSILTLDTTLRSLPVGVKDRVYEADGQMWLEKNVEEHVIVPADITLNTGLSNIDLIEISKANLANITAPTNPSSGQAYVENRWEFKGTSSTWNNSANNGAYAYNSGLSTTSLFLFVAKGTYANLAAAQAALAGTKIHYQLATPQLINLTEQGLVDGELMSFENGTLYSESDTFHAQNVYFNTPINRSAQIDGLLESANAQAKMIEAKANRAQEDWIEPTLLNGWVNYSPTTKARYYKDEFGVVHIEGLIGSGTVTAGTDLFVLPVNYRPIGNRIFAVITATAYTQINVKSDGVVELSLAGNSTYTGLSGISFRAEA